MPESPGIYQEPYRSYHFQLEIEGIVSAYFTECTGLAVNVTSIAFRAGGEGQTVHQLPGPVHYAPAILRYGVTDSPVLWQWMKASMSGHVQRKNVSVLYMDQDGITELTRYNLFDAWPCEWRAAPLDSMSQDVAVETLGVCFDSMDRA